MSLHKKNLHFFIDYTSRLLVGAPLGKNLQPNTKRSGALFKCPITANQKDCEQVITDIGDAGKFPSVHSMFILFDIHILDITGKINVDQLRSPNNALEIKEDQWLGVTVRSGGIGSKARIN